MSLSRSRSDSERESEAARGAARSAAARGPPADRFQAGGRRASVAEARDTRREIAAQEIGVGGDFGAGTRCERARRVLHAMPRPPALAFLLPLHTETSARTCTTVHMHTHALPLSSQYPGPQRPAQSERCGSATPSGRRSECRRRRPAIRSAGHFKKRVRRGVRGRRWATGPLSILAGAHVLARENYRRTGHAVVEA